MDLNFHKVKDIILTKDQYSEKGCNWVDVSIITDKGEEMNLTCFYSNERPVRIINQECPKGEEDV